MTPLTESETLSEYFPIRITASMKKQLEYISRNSVSTNLSDHVRYALRLYIEANAPVTVEELAQAEVQPQ